MSKRNNCPFDSASAERPVYNSSYGAYRGGQKRTEHVRVVVENRVERRRVECAGRNSLRGP